MRSGGLLWSLSSRLCCVLSPVRLLRLLGLMALDTRALGVSRRILSMLRGFSPVVSDGFSGTDGAAEVVLRSLQAGRGIGTHSYPEGYSFGVEVRNIRRKRFELIVTHHGGEYATLHLDPHSAMATLKFSSGHSARLLPVDFLKEGRRAINSTKNRSNLRRAILGVCEDQIGVGTTSHYFYNLISEYSVILCGVIQVQPERIYSSAHSRTKKG